MTRDDRSLQVRAYQRYTVGVILGPLAKRLVEWLWLRPGERVLDLACGTGAVARAAAAAVGAAGRVAGLDIDASSLAVASRERNVGARIEWLQASVDALPFANGTFDAALCSQGLQFFPDRAQALREAHRAVAPGGRLAACVWRGREHNPYYQALQDALDPHLDAATAATMAAPFALADPVALRAAFTDAEWDVEVKAESFVLPMPSLERFIPGHFAGMTAGRELGALSEAALERVIRRVDSGLCRYRDGDGFKVPFEVHLAIGHRAR